VWPWLQCPARDAESNELCGVKWDGCPAFDAFPNEGVAVPVPCRAM
jgi:hypothetical protein